MIVAIIPLWTMTGQTFDFFLGGFFFVALLDLVVVLVFSLVLLALFFFPFSFFFAAGVTTGAGSVASIPLERRKNKSEKIPKQHVHTLLALTSMGFAPNSSAASWWLSAVKVVSSSLLPAAEWLMLEAETGLVVRPATILIGFPEPPRIA